MNENSAAHDKAHVQRRGVPTIVPTHAATASLARALQGTVRATKRPRRTTEHLGPATERACPRDKAVLGALQSALHARQSTRQGRTRDRGILSRQTCPIANSVMCALFELPFMDIVYKRFSKFWFPFQWDSKKKK